MISFQSGGKVLHDSGEIYRGRDLFVFDSWSPVWRRYGAKEWMYVFVCVTPYILCVQENEVHKVKHTAKPRGKRPRGKRTSLGSDFEFPKKNVSL